MVFEKQTRNEDTNNRYSLLMPPIIFKMLEVNNLIYSLQRFHEGHSLFEETEGAVG